MHGDSVIDQWQGAVTTDTQSTGKGGDGRGAAGKNAMERCEAFPWLRRSAWGERAVSGK